MNTSNLVKMTFGVVFATAATFIVNSNEISPTLPEVDDTVTVENAVAKSASLQQQDFAQLLSQFDTDMDGSLSEAELSTTGNEALKIAFKNLDANKDSNISAEEFNTFSSATLD